MHKSVYAVIATMAAGGALGACLYLAFTSQDVDVRVQVYMTMSIVAVAYAILSK